MERVPKLRRRHRKIAGFAGGGVACAVAVVYMFVVPGDLAGVPLYAWLVLRYAHSLCWLCLALAGVLYAVGAPKRAVETCLWVALAVYAGYIATFIATQAGV